MAAKRPSRAAKARKTSLQGVPAAALIFCASLIAYLPALQGGLIMDDADHLTAPELQPLHGLWLIWFKLGATIQYWPLLHSAFWLEHRLWGDSVLGYHLMNVLFHAASACLIVAIARRLSLPGAYLAGLFWALHPVCVQSVAWISEQKNTLSTMFYLGSLLSYLEFDRSRRRSRYFLALGLFVAAMLSKSVTATLPAALLVIQWWRRGRLDWKQDLRPLAPWLAIGAAYGLFTSWFEVRYIGAAGEEFALTLAQRCLLAGRVIWFYFGKLVWPVDLTYYYPRWTFDASGWWYLPLVGVLLAAGAGVWLAVKGRRGPLAAFLLFAGSLFPVLGFLNVYPFVQSYVADHFQYLASLFAVVALASGLVWAVERAPASARKAVSLLPAALVVVLGALTLRQSSLYRDAETLYRDTLTRGSASWVAHINLANVLADQPGRMPEALEHYEAGLKMEPRSYGAHYNYAAALAETPGRLQDAIAEYEISVRIKPDYADAQFNLANALLKIPGRTDEAIAHYEAALRIRPDMADAHANLGGALTQIPGRMPEAIAHLRTALQINPNLPEAHLTLAGALLKMPGRTAEAIAEYQAAVRSKPDFPQAHFNLGVLLADMPGRMPDAIAEYEAALHFAPDFAEAHYRMGLALAKMPGRLSEGISHIEAALQLRPDVSEMRQALAQMRAAQSRGAS